MNETLNKINELFRLSLPIALGSISSTIIGVLSISVLGNYSIEAMAASSVATSIHLIFTNVFLAFYLGFRVLSSKALGRDERHVAQRLFGSLLSSSVMLGIVLCGIIYFTSGFLVSFFNLNPETENLSSKMLKLYALSYPFIAINQSFISLFFVNKKTKICMGISVASDVIGIILSFILVYGFLFISGVGPIGVAIATLALQILQLGFFLLFFKISLPYFNIRPLLHPLDLKNIYKISFPAMVTMFFDYFGSSLIFFMIAYFLSSEYFVSSRIAFSVSIFFFSLISSMSSGFFIMGARSIAKNEVKEFWKYAKANQILVLGVVATLSIPLCFLPNGAFVVFTKFQNIQSHLGVLFVYVTISTVLTSIWFNFSVILRIFEKTKLEMYANIISLWCIQLPMAYILGVYFGFAVKGFFMGLILADIVFVILNIIFVTRVTKFSCSFPQASVLDKN